MKTTRNITFVALFTAFLCVLAPLSIPIQPVPITLATLAVYVIGALLDYKRAPICVFLYIVIGALGLPVFSNYTGGIAKLLSPTGGFIVGYLFGVLAQSLLTTLKKDKFYIYPIAMVVSTIVIYAFGVAWFILVYLQKGETKSLSAVLAACVTPFLLGDALKIVAASLASFKLRKPLERALMISSRRESEQN